VGDDEGVKKTADDLGSFHENYDVTLKDSFNLFKDDALEFLGIDGALLSETTVSAALAEVVHLDGDVTFAMVVEKKKSKKRSKNKQFGIDIEMEAHLSSEDLRRFLAYNTIFMYKYGCEFKTYIITTSKPDAEKLDTSDVKFTPTVIKIFTWDGDKIFNDMVAKLEKGEKVNKLSLVYLPLTGGKTAKLEKVKQALSLIPKVADNPALLKRLASLIFLVSNKILTSGLERRN
jgi:hypothetical protein